MQRIKIHLNKIVSIYLGDTHHWKKTCKDHNPQMPLFANELNASQQNLYVETCISNLLLDLLSLELEKHLFWPNLPA